MFRIQHEEGFMPHNTLYWAEERVGTVWQRVFGTSTFGRLATWDALVKRMKEQA